MEQKLNFKNIKILDKKSYGFININSDTLLVASSGDKIERYLYIPKGLNIEKKELFFSVSSCSISQLNNFVILLNSWLKSLSRPLRKKLVLKGLGYKASFMENNKFMELKLGFSHSVVIPLPSKDINIKLNKNIITLEGFNRSIIGNFTSKIRHLKLPDDYKGKGIWYQNENKKLKELKKK